MVHAETSIPKPDVPTFTAKLVDRSYDVPATSSIDPYTGQIVNNPAHHVENLTIEISIKNQPNEQNNNLYYNIRTKGHFSVDWDSPLYPSDGCPPQSNLTYSVLDFIDLLEKQAC